MSDGVIRIGSTFDIAQLQAAFAQAGGDAQKFISQLGVTFEQGRASTQRASAAMSQSVKDMASQLTPAQEQLGLATRKLSEAQADLRRSFVQLRDPSFDAARAARENTAALIAQAAAEKELRAARVAADIGGTAGDFEHLAGASGHAVSGVQATSAAIRSLEGNAGIRAVENFIAKTLGLGPAMQALFPIVGALAFGKILFDIGEEVVTVEQKAQNAATAINEAFDDLHDKAQVSNDDLRITNDKLQDEIDKLSGHPNNGLQTALDEARKMADQLLSSLQADRKELEALLKEHNVGAFGSLLTGVATGAEQQGTGTQSKEMIADQQKLIEQVRAANVKFEAEAAGGDSNAIKAATDRRNAAVRVAFEAQISAYKTEAQRLRDEQKKNNDRAALGDDLGKDGGGLGGKIDNSAKIANIEGRTRQLQDALTHETYTESIAQREQTVAKLKGGKEEVAAGKKAAEERLKQMEATLAEEKLEYNLSTKAVFDYWAARRDAFTAGSEQYNQVTEKMAALAVEGSRKASEAIKKYKAEQSKLDETGAAALEKSTASMAAWSEQTANNIFRTGKAWDSYFNEVAKGDEITAAIAEEISLAQLRALEASGGITQLGAAQVQAAMHAEEHRKRLQALREELERLEKGATRDGFGKVTDPKQAAQIAGVQNQITQEQGKGDVQGIQDRAAISNAMAKPYLAAFNEINQGWLKVQNDLLAGNRRIGRDFAEMALHMAQSAAAGAEKMLADAARVEVRKMMLHLTTQKTILAEEKAGAHQSDQVSALSAIKQAGHAAKVAAAKAWSALSGIPIVGPELGAVAAAATYAGVMALASFDTGTAYVPHDGIAMIHQGETILPPPQAAVLRDALSGDGGGGSDVHLHMGGNQFSSADGNFHSQFEAHERSMIKTINRWHREGKLNMTPGRR